jgi:putative Mn2+ efflux pump MntP
MWSAIALAFGLAMDATAVSAARGLGGHARRELVILPVAFGGFQAGMAALGWLLGRWVGEYIAAWDHWVAFGLLVAIGGKMIVDAVRSGDSREHPRGTVLVYLALAVATSIDAAAAGLALPLVPVSPWLALTLIGGVTAGCSAAGFVLGRAIGGRLGSKLELAGGVVLVIIGIEILLRSVW